MIIISSLTAQAQQPQLEEVVVTAQKREQNLQDVPLSVSVVSGDKLDLLNENEIFAMQ